MVLHVLPEHITYQNFLACSPVRQASYYLYRTYCMRDPTHIAEEMLHEAPYTDDVAAICSTAMAASANVHQSSRQITVTDEQANSTSQQFSTCCCSW